MEPIKTSFSEITLGRRCTRAYAFRYRENLQRKKPGKPALVGTILHDMLDAYVKQRLDSSCERGPWEVWEEYSKKFNRLFRGEREEYGDIPEISEKVFEGYLRRWRGDGLKYLGSEIHIEVEIDPGIILNGYLDAIVQDRQKRRFLMERKFRKTIPGPDERFSDIQTLLYMHGYNLTVPPKKRLIGVIWDYGKMKAPAVPELLQSGDLSKRANIDTDVFTYRQAIKANNLNPKKYSDILAKLEGRERNFFERVTLPRPPKRMVETVVQDAIATIKNLRSLEYFPHEMSKMNCNICDFRSLCEAEVRGLDVDFIRKKDYRKRSTNSRRHV